MAESGARQRSSPEVAKAVINGEGGSNSSHGRGEKGEEAPMVRFIW